MGTEQTAFGTILKQGATVIGNLLSVSFGGIKIDFAETTYHGLADPFKTFRATLGEAQECDCKVQCTAAQFGTLMAYAVPTVGFQAWTITYPFSPTQVVTLSAQVSEIGVPSAEVGGILDIEFKLKVSGKPTVAAGA